MAQDDGVVDGQCQLQNDGDRVGDEGDGPAQEVGAHIQKGGGTEGQDQHRHLGIGAGCQGQHHHDDDRCDHQNHTHLTGKVGGHILSDLGVNVGVVPRQRFPDSVQGLQADVVGGCAVKGDGIQGRRLLVMVGGIVKLHAVYAVHILNGAGQVGGRIVGHVGHHDPGGAEGGEIVVHHGQPLAGLCGVRQVLRDVVADADPVPGEQAEQQRTRVQEKDQLPLIHDHRGQPHKKGWFFSVFAHSFSSFRQSRSHHGSGEIRLPSHRIRQTSAVITPVRRSPWSSSAVSQKRVLTAVRIA